jgi:RNA 2',3'-cyclic 3'-phosphodiesterase
MRLFVALDIDTDIRRRIAKFRDEMRPFAPDVRWVGPETFHITVQFLGETRKLSEIQNALRQVNGVPAEISFRGVGFFPSQNTPRVFWVGIEADRNLQELVTSIAKSLEPLGFERDCGSFKPHLTLARAGSGRPHPVSGERPAAGLRQVRAKLETIPSPEFGTMTAHEFYLYESKLSPAGAQYTKLSRYPLNQNRV